MVLNRQNFHYQNLALKNFQVLHILQLQFTNWSLSRFVMKVISVISVLGTGTKTIPVPAFLIPVPVLELELEK